MSVGNLPSRVFIYHRCRTRWSDADHRLRHRSRTQHPPSFMSRLPSQTHPVWSDQRLEETLVCPNTWLLSAVPQTQTGEDADPQIIMMTSQPSPSQWKYFSSLFVTFYYRMKGRDEPCLLWSWKELTSDQTPLSENPSSSSAVLWPPTEFSSSVPLPTRRWKGTADTRGSTSRRHTDAYI